MLSSGRPFDIVHIAHTTFPEDPRPRREAMIAAEMGARVAILVTRGGRDNRPVSRYGKVVVIRLEGKRRRGSVGKYLFEYGDFLIRAHVAIRRNGRLRNAKVFHVHTLPDFLVAAVRRFRRRGARVILDLHEVFPEFTRSRFGGWKGAVGERIALLLERWSRRQADVLITVNHAVEEQLRRRPAMAAERILVVHNFADPREFGPRRLTTGVAGTPLRLVYHGTLTPLYGLDLAIDAIAELLARGIPVSLDIYGEGPAKEALQAQIARLGLGDSVRLPGIARHDQLPDLLTTYDAGLVPTRLDGMTRFSLSTKLLEYVHFGVPIILPAIPTYVTYFPRETAWYFAPNSSEDMAREIESFARSESAERVRRARAAQNASMINLDPERDTQRLQQVYRDCMG